MAKQKNQVAVADTVETTVPGKKGRPATFPGVECNILSGNIPQSTIDSFRAVVAKRDINANAALNAAVEQYVNRANRRQGATGEGTDAAPETA